MHFHKQTKNKSEENNVAELTPMMKQYMETKNQYKDCIIFYRLGDFYEMFFEDALVASKELEITLTGRDCGMEERAPMCGVPYHACDTYLNRLIEKGYKVAICEQVEDKSQAKGIVRREVIRVVTPGTNMCAGILDETKNNYLMSICGVDQLYGISTVDITTGDFKTCQVYGTEKVIDEINKFMPAEIIGNDAFLISGIDIDYLRERLHISVSVIEPWYFDEDMCINLLKSHFSIGDISGIGLKDYPVATISSGALLKYLYETQKSSLTHLNKLHPYSVEEYMIIDSSSRRNLELCETLRDKTKRGSLLWVLDKTKTAMGARLLREYIEQPLISKEKIEERFDAIEALNSDMITREEIREYMHPIYDLERLMGRVSLRTANPRDLIAFKTSIELLPHIKTLLGNFPTGILNQIYNDLDELRDLYHLIDSSIIDEPPIAIKEGGIIKDDYNDDINLLKKAKTDGKEWLVDLENREKEASGIKNLKIKYNKVFGYYFEVTNSYKGLVPEHFIRKQTLANAERYTTDELNKLADTILGAEDKLCALEYEIYIGIREELALAISRVQQTAHLIAMLDVFASLGKVADRNSFVRPMINTEGVLDIKGGRHPVVEKMLNNDMFISNDTHLDNGENRVSIITGPNMAGKSTYMRQTALIVLMAQIGSFVPATTANIGIVDRIFTRVGASDDLASGQSTFMVEMSEVANILRNATSKSLLILDEIGRGTSTYDGLSIAWAVVEYISNTKILGAKTLFATHYHELTELEGKLSNVNNYCIAVKEQGEDIVFLRKIIKGGADRSYGIQVAKLAGVPDEVIARAREISMELSGNDIVANAKKIEVNKAPKPTLENMQLSLFASPTENEVITEIKSKDLSNMTPINALLYLNELQNRINS